MGIEDRLPDVLQNIEFAIVSVHKDRPGLSDYDVMAALDTLIALYRAESRCHSPQPILLEGQELQVFEFVKYMCERRMGRAKEASIDGVLPTGTTSLDDILSCLRRIRKSVELWNDRGGRQGYLTFISHYVK